GRVEALPHLRGQAAQAHGRVPLLPGGRGNRSRQRTRRELHLGGRLMLGPVSAVERTKGQLVQVEREATDLTHQAIILERQVERLEAERDAALEVVAEQKELDEIWEARGVLA